jgi:uncharacterized damage-inducible protein DinB
MSPTRSNEQIVDQLQRAFSENAWHGPSLLETLDGVEFDIASAHPIPGAHSIWELVIHLTAWKDVVRQRLTSLTPILPSDAEDWPLTPQSNANNWATSLEKLSRAHEQLVTAVRELPVEAFDQIVPGKDYAASVMLFGVAQHDDYHAGQISLLRKACRNSK